ncbi:MAG TPA: DNA mismatch repair endonuclease MutL [Candidatus Limnocylindrales bacterium]|nr:DNA mismatch repair endonuclease MutL [Candidatus Limnocylindrales bacterium]
MAAPDEGAILSPARTIRRLPDHLVNKIAAGEVVERPASAVKELVENALDAESTQITVELSHAGTQLIRVIDDGIGMTAEELDLALTRHATSKIATEADLEEVRTLGFRGEALPAICAVTRFTLTSCPRGAATGTRISGEGGAIAQVLTVAASAGTTVETADLFFNTPARLKFLKSPRTELALILRGLGAIAIAHPEVHLRVVHDGRPSLTAPRAATLRDRLGAIYGFDLAGKLLDVSRSQSGLTVSGLVAPPQLARGSRDEITLIVNGRPVRDTLLTQTLLDAYRPLLARDQFPLAALHLALPPQEVDVNVHPTKAWVRFRAPRLIQEALFLAVQEALRSAAVVQRQAGLGALGPLPAGTESVEGAAGVAEAQHLYAASSVVAGEHPRTLFDEPGAPAPDLFGAVVGQLQETFIVSASDEEVFFVDQHVAHERVLFERLQGELASGPLASQELLFPETLDLPRGQTAMLEEWRPALDRLGFALEGFGGASVLLRAVPALLRAREPRRLIERLLDEVGAPARDATVPLLDRALAFVACRAAIKAPAPLEREEMRRLLTDLSATGTPYFCPHGRPIVSRLSLREIKRELRRTW